jgi:hypothetical protein
MESSGRFDHLKLTSFAAWNDAIDAITDFMPTDTILGPLEKALREFFRPGPNRYNHKNVLDAIATVRNGGRFNGHPEWLDLLTWVEKEVQGFAPSTASILHEQSPVERYAAAYRKARFWWGIHGGDPDVIAAQGMKIGKSNVAVHSSDPGHREKTSDEPGPLCLGLSKSTSISYGSGAMFRVFLDRAMCDTWVSTPPQKFTPGDTRLYRDGANSNAALVMCDVPPERLLYGTHKQVIIAKPDSPRSKEIVRCIGSFDSQIPVDHKSLIALHTEAVNGSYIADAWEHDSAEDKEWLTMGKK